METPNKDQIKKELLGWLDRNAATHKDSFREIHNKVLTVFCVLTPAGIEIPSAELWNNWVLAQKIVAELFSDTEEIKEWLKTGNERTPEDMEKLVAAQIAVMREFMRLVNLAKEKTSPEVLWNTATWIVGERSYLPIIESDKGPTNDKV